MPAGRTEDRRPRCHLNPRGRKEPHARRLGWGRSKPEPKGEVVGRGYDVRVEKGGGQRQVSGMDRAPGPRAIRPPSDPWGSVWRRLPAASVRGRWTRGLSPPPLTPPSPIAHHQTPWGSPHTPGVQSKGPLTPNPSASADVGRGWVRQAAGHGQRWTGRCNPPPCPLLPQVRV